MEDRQLYYRMRGGRSMVLKDSRFPQIVEPANDFIMKGRRSEFNCKDHSVYEKEVGTVEIRVSGGHVLCMWPSFEEFGHSIVFPW